MAEQALVAVVVGVSWLSLVWAESVDEGSENAPQHTQVGSHSEHDPWKEAAVDDSWLGNTHGGYGAREDSLNSNVPLHA